VPPEIAMAGRLRLGAFPFGWAPPGWLPSAISAKLSNLGGRQYGVPSRRVIPREVAIMSTSVSE
jgi:hypothetical protein